MALTCARCGTQNPDGNQFCQACGTPLSAAAAAPPPAPPAGPIPGPPPGAPPPTYQSPYYAPTGAGQPAVHRTPWVLIISAVVALVLVMAGCGTAIAVLGSRTASQGNSGGIGSQLPSSTPAGSPSSIQSPIPSPSPGPGGSNIVSNAALSITVPAGWNVINKDDESISLTDPSGTGSVTIASGSSSPPQTAQQNKDTLTKAFQSHYPDTKTCPNSKTTTGTLNGAQGIFWELCFTLTAGGQSIQAGAPMFTGANANGNVYYAVVLVTTADNMANFASAARPLLLSIVWKLK